MKRQRVFHTHPGMDASPWLGYPSIKFANTHLYTRVKRGTVKIKFLAQEHKRSALSSARIRTVDREPSALTIGLLQYVTFLIELERNCSNKTKRNHLIKIHIRECLNRSWCTSAKSVTNVSFDPRNWVVLSCIGYILRIGKYLGVFCPSMYWSLCRYSWRCLVCCSNDFIHWHQVSGR